MISLFVIYLMYFVVCCFFFIIIIFHNSHLADAFFCALMLLMRPFHKLIEKLCNSVCAITGRSGEKTCWVARDHHDEKLQKI